MRRYPYRSHLSNPHSKLAESFAVLVMSVVGVLILAAFLTRALEPLPERIARALGLG